MEQFEIDALERFHSAYYRPENLTLILIGGFEREKTLDLVRKHLGGLKLPAAEKPTPIDWSKVPRAATVRWDSKVTAVCLAFPPPADRLDQIVLSLWGSVLAERLRTDAEILAAAEMVDCTNHLWAVGELPFYIYATVNGGSSPEAVEKILRNRAEALAGERPSETVLTQMRMRATQLSAPTQRLTTEQVLADAAKLRGDRLDHLGAAGGEQTLREVGWGELQKAGRLGAGQIVQGDGPDGTTALKIEHASDDAASITVLTIEDPGITTSRYAIVGQVRCADVMKPGHLELLNYFPDGGPYFSRTLMDAGPMQKLQGTSVWRAFELPFTLTDSPLRPTKLELNVVLPGRGTVCLSPLRLVQYGTPQPTRRPARAADASAQPVQDRATAMVVGQAAINWGVAHRLFGPDPSESLRKLEALTAADLHGIIERYLSTDRAFATTLLPAGSGK